MKHYEWSMTRAAAQQIYDERMEWVVQAVCDAVATHWLVERERITFWEVRRQNRTHVQITATDGGVGDEAPKILYLQFHREATPEGLDKFNFYVQVDEGLDGEQVRVLMLPEDY